MSIILITICRVDQSEKKISIDIANKMNFASTKTDRVRRVGIGEYSGEKRQSRRSVVSHGLHVNGHFVENCNIRLFFHRILLAVSGNCTSVPRTRRLGFVPAVFSSPGFARLVPTRFCDSPTPAESSGLLSPKNLPRFIKMAVLSLNVPVSVSVIRVVGDIPSSTES